MGPNWGPAVKPLETRTFVGAVFHFYTRISRPSWIHNSTLHHDEDLTSESKVCCGYSFTELFTQSDRAPERPPAPGSTHIGAVRGVQDDLRNIRAVIPISMLPQSSHRPMTVGRLNNRNSYISWTMKISPGPLEALEHANEPELGPSGLGRLCT